MNRGQATCGELTYAEIAEEVERAFGRGSVGLGAENGEDISVTARAAFVGASLLLVVKQRCEDAGLTRREQPDECFRINREVRRECSALLGVDENEAFRLHHHAAGLRARSPEYRDETRKIEWVLAEKHGMTV